MLEGRGINIKNFGTFTFEPCINNSGNVKNPNLPKAQLRPCFIESPEIRKHLHISSIKDQLSHHVQGSIYQQGVRVSYLNPLPIAKGAYYDPEFVREGLETIFRAISDLVFRGFNLNIEFEDLCVVKILNKRIKVHFSPQLATKISAIESLYPLKSINGSRSALAPDTHGENISRVHALRNCKNESGLSKLERPNSAMLSDIKQRIQRLSESSKDLCNVHVS